MDRKTIFILLACVALLFTWPALVEKVFPPRVVPEDQRATNQVAQTESVTNRPVTPAPGETNAPGVDADSPAPVEIEDDAPEEILQLENELTRFTVTSRGGGISLVELEQYPRVVDCDEPAAAEDWVRLNAGGQLPVLALAGDRGHYTLEKRGDTITATGRRENGLVIRKVFQLSTNYLITARVEISNPTDQPVELPEQLWSAGTSTPLGMKTDPQYVGFFWSDGEDSEKVTDGWFENRFLGCFPGTPRQTYIDGRGNVVWAAVMNQFFTLATVPGTPAERVVANRVDLPVPTEEELAADPGLNRTPRGHELTMAYPATVIAAGGKVEHDFTLYAGPKEYNRLAALALDMKNNLDEVMDFGISGFFAKILLQGMNGVHNLMSVGYGLAIVIVTFVIKMCFWPLTAASTRSMKRMAEFQPQMKEIQTKYKDDPQKMNKKLMEFMKEKKVNPVGGCLPLLLQMPVFFGFYAMLQTAVELRGADFLWICDLSRPDTLFVLPGFGIPFNLMPLVMGATMLYQARLTPPSPGMDPTQQKMLRYMPLIFIVFLYNMSSGLTLYWTVQNILSIVQTKLTKTHVATDKPAAGPSPAPQGKPKPAPAAKPPGKSKGKR